MDILNSRVACGWKAKNESTLSALLFRPRFTKDSGKRLTYVEEGQDEEGAVATWAKEHLQ